MPLTKDMVLKAALSGIEAAVDKYNVDNDSIVDVGTSPDADNGGDLIEIDGGNVHGAWCVTVSEL